MLWVDIAWSPSMGYGTSRHNEITKVKAPERAHRPLQIWWHQFTDSVIKNTTTLVLNHGTSATGLAAAYTVALACKVNVLSNEN